MSKEPVPPCSPEAFAALAESQQHWLFLLSEYGAVGVLYRISQEPEMARLPVQHQAASVDAPELEMGRLWLVGFPKWLVPPQVMMRICDRVGVPWSVDWLAGWSNFLCLCCREEERTRQVAVVRRALGEDRYDIDIGPWNPPE